MKLSDDRRRTRDERRGTKHLSSILLSSIVLSCFVGCQDARQNESMAARIEELTQEKAQLQAQIEQAQAENQQLKERVQVLSGLPEQARIETIRRLESVKIGRFTGFYDKDKDGKKEKLIVYVEPMDQQGDRIKAAGTVDVQLWDLDKSQGDALLGQWHVPADELAREWFDTLLSTNYRCVFDIAGKVTDFSRTLTAKVTFTDYLTGRTFTDQMAIKPQSE